MKTLSDCALGVAIFINLVSFVYVNGIWTAYVVTMLIDI